MNDKVQPKTKHVLGHTFKPFDRMDWDVFAGADEGSYICYCSDGATALILSPDGEVSEVVDHGDQGHQQDWKATMISSDLDAPIVEVDLPDLPVDAQLANIKELTFADCVKFFDSRASDRDKQIANMVKCGDEEFECDNNIVSGGDDNGAYVMGWRWVSFADTSLDKSKTETGG